MDWMLQTERLVFPTQGNADMKDITRQVNDVIHRCGLEEGQVLLSVVGSTAALTTIEYEPGLCKDFPGLFERLAPEDAFYHHEATWNDDNGHSHVRASLLGPSLLLPVEQGQMILGTWQQVVLVDFDTRPRQREIIVQLSGRHT